MDLASQDRWEDAQKEINALYQQDPTNPTLIRVQTWVTQQAQQRRAQAIEEKNWLAMYVWKEDDFFDALLNDSGIPMDMRAEIFPRVLEYAECMCSRDQFRDVTVHRKSAFSEDPLLPWIIKERIRQIRAIKSAMQRVADFVYTNKLTP